MQKTIGALQIATPSDREISMARTFNAPASLLWEAITRPEYIRRWLLGPVGWEMTRCEVDFRIGGSYRYEWRKDSGETLGVGGVYRAIVPQKLIETTEEFDEPWYEGEAIATQTLVEAGGTTTLTLTVRYASKDVRDGVLKSGMEQGVAACYDRLATIISEAGERLLPTAAEPSPRA